MPIKTEKVKWMLIQPHTAYAVIYNRISKGLITRENAHLESSVKKQETKLIIIYQEKKNLEEIY